MKNLIYVIKVLYALKLKSKMKVKRSFSDFLADRIIQAGTEKSLLGFIEKLAGLLDSDMGEVYSTASNDFLIIQKKEGMNYLNWLRTYPRIAAMIICLPKYSDIEQAVEQVEVEEYNEKSGIALSMGKFDIPIEFTTLSPLSHGGDTKAGNATLFRRMDVMSKEKTLLNLPFYAGNAIRGEMRDLLADNFFDALDIKVDKTNPKIALWFFHSIYSGGALEKESNSTKAIGELLGKNGLIKAEGLHEFRDTFPALSLLGSALGNRILPGRINVSDYRPECKEWGNGENSVYELFDWLFLTRREDHEGHEDGDNAAMIANTEVIKPGVKFHGGIDLSHHISNLEKSALGLGLELLQERGYIGANNNRGYGKIRVDITNCPDSKLYKNFLLEKKEEVLKLLGQLNILQD